MTVAALAPLSPSFVDRMIVLDERPTKLRRA